MDAYGLQAAVHRLLREDAGLMAQVSGVYDHVPEKTAYPYLTIGEARVEDVSAVMAPMWQVDMVVHIYSRSRGRKEIADIMTALYRLLDDAALDVEGNIVVSMRYTGSEIMQVKDGLTYHGRMGFVALMQKELG